MSDREKMTMVANYVLPDTLVGLLILVLGIIILWAVISLPVYVAGKLVTAGKSDYGDAMAATLGGAIGYIVVFWGGTFALSYIMAPASAVVIAFIFALIVWVAIYAASFDTSWFGGLGIAIVGWAVLVIVDIILMAIFGVAIPKFFPF